MKPIPDVSVILVGWNSLGYVLPCLRSLYSAGLRSSFETIFIDNASTDGSVAAVRGEFPGVRVIRNSGNVGFAAACNQGVRASAAPYALFLNCDTIVNGGSLDALVDFMKSRADAGAAGGNLLNPDGSFQGGWANFSSLPQEFLISLRIGALLFPGYPCHHRSREITAVDWVSGACLIVRRDLFESVGYLDENYVMYSEEVDWQYRIRRAGWKVYYLPGVHTIHHGGGSQDRWKRRRMVYRGKILFYAKNYAYSKQLALRVLLAAISIGKLSFWGAARLARGQSGRPAKELRANREVLDLCLRPR